MTQRDLAAAAGISYVHIARLEQSRGGPPYPSTLAKLATALEVSPGWLETGTGLPRRATIAACESRHLP